MADLSHLQIFHASTTLQFFFIVSAILSNFVILGCDEGRLDNLSYDTLIPANTLQNYLRLVSGSIFDSPNNMIFLHSIMKETANIKKVFVFTSL